MSLAEIIKYEEDHYKLDLPGCWVDEWSTNVKQLRASTGHGQCHRKSAAYEATWDPIATAFERDPPPEWYPLVKRLRELATHHGKPDPRGKD